MTPEAFEEDENDADAVKELLHVPLEDDTSGDVEKDKKERRASAEGNKSEVKELF